MPGNGHIGGGGSCLVSFVIEDDDGTQRWSAVDGNADERSTFTVELSGATNIKVAPNKQMVSFHLKRGASMDIDWDGFERGSKPGSKTRWRRPPRP
jgi:hypothetical protein